MPCVRISIHIIEWKYIKGGGGGVEGWGDRVAG